jgi:hypothetical protein
MFSRFMRSPFAGKRSVKCILNSARSICDDRVGGAYDGSSEVLATDGDRLGSQQLDPGRVLPAAGIEGRYVRVVEAATQHGGAQGLRSRPSDRPEGERGIEQTVVR